LDWDWPGPNVPDYFGYWWTGTEWEMWLEIPGEKSYSVNPYLKNPFSHQFSIGLQRELFPYFTVEATFIYKRQKDLLGFENTDAIYEQVERTSPDNDQTYEVHNQLNPGEYDFQLTNPGDWGQNYKSLILSFIKRYSNNWLLNASLTWSKAEGLSLISYSPTLAQGVTWYSGRTGADPNDLINARGVLNLDRLWVFKLSAGYNFPWNILASAIFSFQTGRPRLTYVRIYELDQYRFYKSIIAQPRETDRFDALSLLDFRLQKTFGLHKSFRIQVMLDVFNLLNTDTFTGYWTYALWSPYYGVPGSMPRPRRVQVGIKLVF